MLLHPLSIEGICKEIYQDNRNSIKIKKEELAIKNLTKIMKTVIKISHKQGFHAMSLRDLSRESELSMGALYNYFSSKEEFLNMMYIQGQALINKIMQESIRAGQNSSERLLRGICTHLYLSESISKIFYFFYMEAKSLKPEDQKKAITMEQFTENVFEELLKDGIQNGEFEIPYPLLTASAIKALLQDWYLKRYKYSERKISVEEYANFLIRFVYQNIENTNSKELK